MESMSQCICMRSDNFPKFGILSSMTLQHDGHEMNTAELKRQKKVDPFPPKPSNTRKTLRSESFFEFSIRKTQKLPVCVHLLMCKITEICLEIFIVATGKISPAIRFYAKLLSFSNVQAKLKSFVISATHKCNFFLSEPNTEIAASQFWEIQAAKDFPWSGIEPPVARF